MGNPGVEGNKKKKKFEDKRFIPGGSQSAERPEPIPFSQKRKVLKC